MSLQEPNFYAGAGLDRADARRRDAEWIRSHLESPRSRFLPVWRNRSLVNSIEEPRLTWLERAHVESFIAAGHAVVFLGLDEEQPYFAVDISSHPLGEGETAFLDHGHLLDLRAFGPLLPRPAGAIMAYARGFIHWHARHRHCAVCGAPTAIEQAGHQRRCTNPDCGATHFPRTDPAVIMLVHDGGERCVLGRQAVWPKGMHSVLAGFLEPGESLEEAVAREVEEEVGLRVHDVAYHSSQPWPFPGSLMVGFIAEARFQPLHVAPDELEAAAWYSRAELLASPEDENFRLPRRDSIARRLVTAWLHETL